MLKHLWWLGALNRMCVACARLVTVSEGWGVVVSVVVSVGVVLLVMLRRRL